MDYSSKLTAVYQPRPTYTYVQQNRYARKTLFQSRLNADHESLSCHTYYLMLLYKVARVLLRQMKRMRVHYKVIVLLGIGLVLLCMSRVWTGITADDEQNEPDVQVQKHIHTQPRLNSGKEKIVYEKAPTCSNRRACRLGQLGFHLKSGFETTEKPYICLNNQESLKNEDSGRGLNMVVVDGNVKEVVITKHVDTYTESPPSFVKFLKNIAHGDILIAVTADDAHRMLSKEVKDILVRDFNSRYIRDLKYRATWVFIGQKGIKSSVEIEKLNLVHGLWADRIELQGCLSLPMDTNTSTIEPHRDMSTNCNLPECPTSNFPVAVVSGISTKGVRQTPTICVDGKEVMGTKKIKEYEPGSRGLNCIVFDPTQMKVVKIGRFDTYNSAVDDTMAQTFLDGLDVGQIVIIAVHDEASRKLSFKTKSIIKSLGSSKIEDYNFRDNWMFIGQKGIQGYARYEKLGFREGTGWGPKLEIKDCIPLRMEGVAVASSIINRKREEFCKLYDAYPELCSGENINKTLRPLPLDDKSLSNNPAYNLPIIVVPGVDLEPLQKCLSSLLGIPGLKPNNVLVILNGNFAEPNDLVKLYDFAIEYIKPKADYTAFLNDAISRALELLTGREYLIILEDYLEVTPDFLRYFSQTLHMLARDPSLVTISAWNPNGFVKTSGDESLVYRTDDFPGFGWIVRRSLWTSGRIYKQQNKCCAQPTWRGWTLGDVPDAGSIIPDVSRVKRVMRRGGYYEDKRFMVDYLVNRTSSSASPSSEPTEVYKLEATEYEKEIVRLITNSIRLKPDMFTKCLKGGDLLLKVKPNEKKIYAVLYKQDAPGDQKLLRRICKCFGLFVFEDSHLTNMHHGIIRFMHKGNQFILVGSKTLYSRNTTTSAAEVLSNTDDKG